MSTTGVDAAHTFTDVKKSRPILDAATTVIPQARIVSSARRLAFSTHSFVWRAGIEGEVLDSQTGNGLVRSLIVVQEGKHLKCRSTLGTMWSSYSSFGLIALVIDCAGPRERSYCVPLE